MESGAVELLVGLTARDDPALRLNGIWALMVKPSYMYYLLVIQFNTSQNYEIISK